MDTTTKNIRDTFIDKMDNDQLIAACLAMGGGKLPEGESMVRGWLLTAVEKRMGSAALDQLLDTLGL